MGLTRTNAERAYSIYRYFNEGEYKMTISEMYRRWNSFGELSYEEQGNFLSTLAKCVAYRYGLDGNSETDSIGLVKFYKDRTDKWDRAVAQSINSWDTIRVRIFYKKEEEGIVAERIEDIIPSTLKDLFKYIEKVTGWKPIAHDEDANIVFMGIED